MTCKDCIHKSVCYRIDIVPSDYADKCGDYIPNPDNTRDGLWDNIEKWKKESEDDL